VPRETGLGHPTVKPVELFARPMRNNLKPGELALDMFLGSGTAIIAAEKEGCRCYGMEIDPHYCDVIVARWEAFSGEKARLETEEG
jgi:DNA modification methylase